MRKIIHILAGLLICSSAQAIDIGGANIKDGKIIGAGQELMAYNGTSIVMVVSMVYTNVTANTNEFGTIITSNLTVQGASTFRDNMDGGGNQSTNWSVVSANSIVLNGVTLNTNLQAISNVQRSNDVLVASSTNTLAWTNIPTMAGFNLTFSTSNHPFGMGILNGTQGMYFVTYSNATVYTNWNLGR